MSVCAIVQAPTNSIGVTESSPDEARWLANRTEVYACTLCGTVVRFPRYNHGTHEHTGAKAGRT